MGLKSRKIFDTALMSLMALGLVSGLTSCGQDDSKVVMIWGPTEHEEMYMELGKAFKEANPDFQGEFAFANKGDAGAYSEMAIDAEAGASIYTFANDQLNNLNRLGALAPVKGDNLKWAIEKNGQNTVDVGLIGETHFAYPVQADNGYYMYFNRDAFKDTKVWDAERDSLKLDYTFDDLYAALDEKGGKWANGKVTWAIGDSWYVSGVFFGAGSDYSVKYDEKGNQTEAKCSFGFENGADGKPDYTKGIHAVKALKRTFSNDKGEVNPHFMFSDCDKQPLNDNIDKYKTHEETPLAAAICGTWKAKVLSEAWGENYDATVLPMLNGEGDVKFRMRTFSGYKLMGVNPYSKFAQKSEENLLWLHKLAQFMSDYESQIQRYRITGAGPSNLEALQTDEIKNDIALKALNDQYNLTPKDSVGVEGKGYRVQDSVPANYWTPIQNFGSSLYNEVLTGKGTRFTTVQNIKLSLAQLQSDIENAAK